MIFIIEQSPRFWAAPLLTLLLRTAVDVECIVAVVNVKGFVVVR